MIVHHAITGVMSAESCSRLRRRRYPARQRQELRGRRRESSPSTTSTATFYATDARCTHGFADLAEGILDGDIVECTLHFGAFNVRTGKAVQAPCFVDLKTYRTEVKDGQVFVDLSTPAA